MTTTAFAQFAILGECPTRRMQPHPALWLRPDNSRRRHCVNRLLTFAGWTAEQYLQVFRVRDNVSRTYEWRWSRRARDRARQVAIDAVAGAVDAGLAGVVCLGRRSAEAVFGTNHYEPCAWHAAAYDWSRGDVCARVITRVAWIPHTSGRCRWWNDAVNREQARAFFDTILAEAFPSSF